MKATQAADLRLQLFPINTTVVPGAQGAVLAIDGHPLDSLAEQYGTPLYCYHRGTMDQAVWAYQAALAKYYPGNRGLTYAGKSFLCLAIAQWTQFHEMRLDCSSAGELAIVKAAKVPRARIVLHGVSKNDADLRSGLAHAGTIVVDNVDEFARLTHLMKTSSGPAPKIWLRFRPGISAGAHDYTKTGHAESKFGLDEQELTRAASTCLSENLPLEGIHFHIGSNFRDPSALGYSIEKTLDLAAALRQELGWLPRLISPGGGWGVAYHEDELPQPSIEAYIRFVSTHLVAGCRDRNMPLPRLQIEPGRSLIAQAGIAIYQIQAVKRSGSRRWLLLDGGLADNPRYALYKARYTALPVVEPEREMVGPAWLGGPYCESGDVLISELAMPDLLQGELVAVPVSGAYQLSMSSHYNGATKPAVLWLEEDRVQLIQRRETPEEILRRDVPLYKEEL